MHKTPCIRNGQKQCTKSKHKEARALKEKEKLTNIIGRVTQNSAFEPISGKQ